MAILNFLKKREEQEFPSQPLRIEPSAIPAPKQQLASQSAALPLAIPKLKTIALPMEEHSLPPKQALFTARPLFVRLDQYNIGHSYVITLERDLQKSMSFLTTINTLKNESDKTVIKFFQSLEDIQRKLVHVDRKLFKSF